MVHQVKIIGFFAIVGLLITACTKDSEVLLSSDRASTNAPELNNASTPQIGVSDRQGKSLAIWADCEGFGTVGTPTSFKPTSGKFDELYTGANFKDDLGAISESKPGDQDYNGGRWHVNALKSGVDPNKYSNACAVADLDLNDFEPTTTYFECPLLPIRGKKK